MIEDVIDRDWILLLDDDAAFRKLMSEMLVPLGHSVYEARNAGEATQAVLIRPPALAIVDYRLPGVDGITWITKTREAKYEFPIVFISGQWCDAQMFNKLRNVLRVSLILQKPIMPELFLEQIELMLPAPAKEPNDTKKSAVSAPPSAQKWGQPQTQPMNQTRSDISVMMRQELRHPKAVEDALRAARLEYAVELPALVGHLAHNIRDAKENAQDNKTAFVQAVHHAHQLRGTAGSYGFKQISDGAGKIEGLLRSLENDEGTMQEILWSEIIRILADTESGAHAAAREVERPATDKARAVRILPRHIVFLADDNQWRSAVMPLMEDGLADITIASSAQKAFNFAKDQRPDLLFCDLSACSKADVMALIRDVRLLPHCSNVPIAFAAEANALPAAGEAVYMGSSATLPKPISGVSISSVAQQLLELRQSFMPRVLTVDDDEMLCTFIKTVLEPQGFVVKSLSEPIKILDALDKVAPDVVLLDVMMPAISGYDVCRLIRQQEKWKDIRVLFLTSKSSAEGRASAFSAGADDFLAKPVVSQELVSRVTSQLERSRTLSQRLSQDPLTGLLQRTPFERATSGLVAASKQQKTVLTLVLMEIDRIRDRTTRYGIGIGETMLARLGKLVNARFRAEDVRARLGDFVAVVLPGQNGETTKEAIRLLNEEFSQIKFDAPDGTVVRNSLNFGMSTLWTDCDDAAGLIQIASMALLNRPTS